MNGYEDSFDPYASQSGKRLLILKHFENNRYATLEFKRVTSGNYKQTAIIPLEADGLDEGDTGEYKDESLQRYKLQLIRYRKLSPDSFQITPFFLEGEKPNVELYTVLDNSNNYHKPRGMAVYEDHIRLKFFFPIEDVKTLTLFSRDSETVTFRNISLVPGQISDVQIESEFEPAEGKPVKITEISPWRIEVESREGEQVGSGADENPDVQAERK